MWIPLRQFDLYLQEWYQVYPTEFSLESTDDSKTTLSFIYFQPEITSLYTVYGEFWSEVKVGTYQIGGFSPFPCPSCSLPQNYETMSGYYSFP